MKKLNLKKIKKHVTGAVAVSVASAGIVVGGLFADPSELAGDDGALAPAQIEMIAEDDGGDGGNDSAIFDEKRKNARTRLRQWILQLPPWVRATVALPLWGIGWVLITGFSALWASLLSPIAGSVLKFLCVAALVLGVLCAALKAAFPQLRIKDILNRRSVFTVVLGLALVAAAGIILEIMYPESRALHELVRWGGGFAVFLSAALPVLIRRRGSAAAVGEADDAELVARRRALELADSVK